MLFNTLNNVVQVKVQERAVRGNKVLANGLSAKSVKTPKPWPAMLCRHVLTGTVKAHKICCKNYECYHCAYDQMIADEEINPSNELPSC